MIRFALLINLLLITVFASISAQGLRPLGLIWKDPRLAAPDRQATPDLDGGRVLPRWVDHSAGMPPVGDQGSQGSCTAWAVGYYYKSYQERLEHGWSLDDPARQFSPAFIYNQINGGYDYGSWFGDAFQLLCEQGGASMALFPYNAGDWISWPSEAAYDSALPYRCQEWHWIDVSDDAGIQAVKQRLDTGDNVVIGLLVYSNYDNINQYDTTFCVSEISGDIRGGHANCIVGYDDDRMTSDGQGAFRVVNSWGPGWGNGGYYWFSYQALKDPRTSYQAAFYSDDRIGYQPTLKIKAKVTHSLRNTVEMTAGIGPDSSPLWTKPFYASYGGGPRPFPQNYMVFDLSEGVANLSTSGGNNIYLSCRDVQLDGQSGAIEDFWAVHVPWGCDAQSSQTPVAMEDGYGVVVANLSLRYQNFTVAAIPSMDTVTVGGRASFSVELASLHGFYHPVYLDCQIFPTPTSGSIAAGFSQNPLPPTGSCLLTVDVSPDASPGRYLLTVTASDPVDTIVHRTNIVLWVLGTGQALCVGANAQMASLVRSVYSNVDSVWSVPPVIGGNYQAVVVQSGAVPSDATLLAQYLSAGGRVLLVSNAPVDLSGGTDLSPIAGWFGASVFNYYWGSGIGMICHYDHPFSLPSIIAGDLLATAQYGYGRLTSVSTGATSIAHLGSAMNSVVALVNEHGQGSCFWYAGMAGLGQKSDSLLVGFLQFPQGLQEPGTPSRAAAPGTLRLLLSPNPSPGRLKLTLTMPSAGPVDVRLYDFSGRRLRTLHQGQLAAGNHSFDWHLSDHLPAGLYFIRVDACGQTAIRRLTIID
jgi:hypothetical protein